MRLLSLIVCLCAFCNFAQAQNTTKQGFTFKYLGLDYTSILADDYTYSADKLSPGIELGYHRYLSPSFDLSVPFRYATVNSPTLDITNGLGLMGRSQNLFSLDAVAKYKLANGYIFKESAFIQPYILGGLGLNYIPEYTTTANFHIPVGAGVNIKVIENMFLQGQAEYRLLGDEHLAYTAGVLILFGENAPEEEPVIEEVKPSDKDNDGVIDSEDVCPDVAGLAKYAGCPDTDGDGVIDTKDECPKIAGIAKFNGCPDTDSDGVVDSKDKCPKVAGLAQLNGCPDGDNDNDGVLNLVDKCPEVAGIAKLAGCPAAADADGDGIADADDKCPKIKGIAAFNGCPDTDGDGVADNVDRCPRVAGSKTNSGCPEIKKEEKARLDFAMRAIQFETGKNLLKPSSIAIMDEVASILIKYPNYFVSVEGHTDAVGNAANNMRLSESRAKACHDYLVKKGVSASRISYKGFGETTPIADNGTPAGRTLNRRVEFKLTAQQ